MSVSFSSQNFSVVQGGSTSTTEFFPLIARNTTKFGNGLDGAAIIKFLRDVFPVSTAQHVACATGIATSTIDKWLREAAKPSAEHLGIMVQVFGAPFMAAAFPVSRDWVAGQVQHDAIREALAHLTAALDSGAGSCGAKSHAS